MANFSSIFSGISYQVMFLDPILRAYFEDNREQFFDRSIFDVLTLDLSKRQKKELVFEIGKLLFSLAGCDNKITEEEVKTIKHILSLFTLLKSYKELSAFSVEQMSYDNIPQFFRRIEMRHFLIWILFLFAKADGRISGEEINFIEDRAEELKVNKTNFLFIHDHFVKEEF
jgi:uncharacterized tellurite resistance protein B-like protein